MVLQFDYPPTGMRLFVALGCLLLVGCTGPHSTGALWAQQMLERETASFRLSDLQRAEVTRAFDLSLADAILTAERTRVEALVQACPGPSRDPLVLSMGDRPRDSVRIFAQDDPARLAALAQVALADWHVRRGRATGDTRFCEAAGQALRRSAGLPGGPDVLSGLGQATVSRDPAHSLAAPAGWPVTATLSSYALGAVDTVHAQAPLPQYLAAVYGGVLLSPIVPPAVLVEAPELLVDRLAPAYPMWEPDALYAAFLAI
jgi:hypothetical protein